MTEGCIVDSVKAIVSLYNEDFSAYKKFHYVNHLDINTWDFQECSCATADYINTYFNTPRFFERLEFMHNADYVLSKLSRHFDITIVSHGYSPNLKIKKEWVNKHITPLVHKTCVFDFIGVNLKEHTDKSCIDMSNGIFIDDNISNLATSNASYKIVFGAVHSWNINNEKKQYCYTRAVDWKRVYDIIKTFI